MRLTHVDDLLLLMSCDILSLAIANNNMQFTLPLLPQLVLLL